MQPVESTWLKACLNGRAKSWRRFRITLRHVLSMVSIWSLAHWRSQEREALTLACDHDRTVQTHRRHQNGCRVTQQDTDAERLTQALADGRLLPWCRCLVLCPLRCASCGAESKYLAQRASIRAPAPSTRQPKQCVVSSTGAGPDRLPPCLAAAQRRRRIHPSARQGASRDVSESRARAHGVLELVERPARHRADRPRGRHRHRQPRARSAAEHGVASPGVAVCRGSDGLQLRRHSLAASAHPSVSSRGADHHHSRPRLSLAPRADPRRDPPRLPASRSRPRPPRRSHPRAVAVHSR